MKEKLHKDLNKLLKQANNKGKIVMNVNGDKYGEYELPYEYSVDTKSPKDWLNMNLVFAKYKYGSIENVELKLED